MDRFDTIAFGRYLPKSVRRPQFHPLNELKRRLKIELTVIRLQALCLQTIVAADTP
jgi:hypothetical protein